MVNTSNNVIFCLPTAPDETGCGISIPDGTLTVRLAVEHSYNDKLAKVKMSPVMYHYEPIDPES